MVDFQRDVYGVLGLPFDAVDMAGAIRRVRDAAAQRSPCTICTPNLNFAIGCLTSTQFRDAVLQCDLSIVDGMPEVWIARLLDIPIRSRVAGSNLFDALRDDSSQRLSIYFFGGAEGVAEMACRRLNAEAVGVTCAGFETPGFGSVWEMSGEETIAKINASGADFLVVALGAGKGHAWIAHNRARITVPVVSHLGAVVNFMAGTVRRAPAWMQRFGLEWLWRIREEPALWSRYVSDGLVLLRLITTRVLPYAIYRRLHKPGDGECVQAHLEAREEAKHHVLRLRGAWTRQNIAPLRECFARAVLAERDVRLETAEVTYIDSAFVGLVMLLHGHQQLVGRRLLMPGPGKSVRRVIKYCCADFLLAAADPPNPVGGVRLLNGRFDALSLPQTVDAVFSLLHAGRRGWLCTVNVAILMMMRSDARLQNFVDRAALVVADGQPLVWCAPWFGPALPARVTGVDLVDALCARAAREGRGIYLLGAHEKVVALLAQQLRERHPGLRVDYADGYFTNEEAPARAERIRASGAAILLAGMGVPRQENFIEEQWERLGVGMAIGVGGSFEVLAGVRARAPVWVQKIGMEWFFRLVQEPRRLLPRYVSTNSRFVWLVLCASAKKLRLS